VVSIVNKQRGPANKIAHPLFYSVLPSLLSYLASPYCFEPAIKRVVQVVPIGLRRIFSMLAPRSFKNALRRRSSHWLIGLVVHWLSGPTLLINVRVTCPNLLECYGRSGRSSPDRNLES